MREGKVIFPPQQRQSQRCELNLYLALCRKTLPTVPRPCAWESHARVDGTVRQTSGNPLYLLWLKLKPFTASWECCSPMSSLRVFFTKGGGLPSNSCRGKEHKQISTKNPAFGCRTESSWRSAKLLLLWHRAHLHKPGSCLQSSQRQCYIPSCRPHKHYVVGWPCNSLTLFWKRQIF